MRNIHDTTNFRALDPELMQDLLRAQEQDTPAPGSWQVLRHRALAWLLGAALLSNVGTWMQNTAQAWFIYETTRSAWYLGLNAFLMLSPLFLLTFPGGMVVDRFERRRVFLLASLLQILCTAWGTLLFVTGQPKVWWLLALSFGTGIGQAFANVAYVSLLPRLVPTREVPQATALNSLQLSVARMVGPLAAGGVLLMLGPAACYAANCLSFVLLLVVAGRVPEHPPEALAMDAFARITRPLRPLGRTQPVAGAGPGSPAGAPLSEAASGARRSLCPVLCGHVLRRLCAGAAAQSRTGSLEWPGVALHRAAWALRTGNSAWLALHCTASETGRRRTAGTLSDGCDGHRTVHLCPDALATHRGAGHRGYWRNALIALLSQLTALVQFGLVDEVRGRVMSLFLVTFQGGYALGGLAAGAIASRLSTTITILACGAAVGVAALGGWWLDSHLGKT
jgi:MFS family permease